MIETSLLSTAKAYSFIEGIRNNKFSLYGFFSHVSKPYKAVVIDNATNSNPAVIISTQHGITNGDNIYIRGVQGMTQINIDVVSFTIIDENTISLDNIDSSSFSTYLSGGEIRIENQSNNGSIHSFGCEDVFANNIRKNMLGLQKIQGDCISFVIDRNDYESGKVYDQYSSNTCKPRDVIKNCGCELGSDEQYIPYVITGVGHVYYCLSNNNKNFSYVTPIHTTPWPETLPDGYIWQYMYTVDLVSDKFTTDAYIPLRDLCVDDSSNQWNVIQSKKYNTGEVINTEIISSGDGYINGLYDVDIIGDGIGAKAQISITNNKVTRVNITNNGYGYTYALISGNFSSNSNIARFEVNTKPHYNVGKNQILNFAPCKLMMVWDFNSDQNGKFMVDNSYCSYGLLMNPCENDGEYADGECYDLRKKLTLTNAPSTMQLNETVTNNITNALVTEISGINSNVISVVGEGPYEFSVGDTLSGNLSGSNNTILSIETSEIMNGSGGILSYEMDGINIDRDINQRERYRVILEL